MPRTRRAPAPRPGRQRLRIAALLALLLPATAGGGDAILWAGHQVMHGEIRVPLLGRVRTRSESFLLARVMRRDDGYEISQIACRVEIAPVLGARATLAPAAVQRLPATTFSLRMRDGRLHGPTWLSGWGEEDVEGDGQPGITVHVDAPLCDGELYVASSTRSTARGHEEKIGARGELKVRSISRVLGTSGGCISAFAGDSREELRGTFAYVPVPAGATCESLKGSWPAKAEAR